MYPLTPYPVTPIGNFIAVVLALLPLFSNIRKLSLAVWGYAIWVAVFDFIMFVDTIIWHNNVNIVAPVWCDIVTKLLVGAGLGTRACALTICIHLYKITRLRGPIEYTKKQRQRTMIYEVLLIIGFPVIIMALYIIVQPIRFEILEELGCSAAVYSYVGYIIVVAPPLVTSVGCAVLAPLTLGSFMRHRKEMNEFLSSNRDMSHNKYYRLMIIACLDTLFNLPVVIVILVTEIAQGKAYSLNYSYISWKNVHDGAGGQIPGSSLSTIIQVPASAWGVDSWQVFNAKWDEWIYVVHAVTFFVVFGTTPEMRAYYRSAFWFIPERLGFKRQHVSDVESVSDVAFNSNHVHQEGPTVNRRRGSLSLLETTIDSTSVARYSGSGVANDLGTMITREGIETVSFVVADELQAAKAE